MAKAKKRGGKGKAKRAAQSKPAAKAASRKPAAPAPRPVAIPGAWPFPMGLKP
ncbi:hypothetical protein D3C83_318170 [compost metagenome]